MNHSDRTPSVGGDSTLSRDPAPDSRKAVGQGQGRRASRPPAPTSTHHPEPEPAQGQGQGQTDEILFVLTSPILRPIFDALIDELRDGDPLHHRRPVFNAVLERTACQPKTLNTVIQQLARYGIIDRPTSSNRSWLRLTTLGRAWLVDTERAQ